MIKCLFLKLQAHIDAHITHRINMFHDAMVRRGQIKYIGETSPQQEVTTDESTRLVY